MTKKIIQFLSFALLIFPAQAQLYSASDLDKNYDLLLKNPGVQIEATEAINLLYNYKFEEADKEFRWLKYRYPKHPMPHFLMGLAEWWKIVPNTDNTAYDNRLLAHLDSCIVLAEQLYEEKENKVEPSFFLAAAYAFKGRLYSERKQWTKATFAGKNSLKYLEKSKGYGDLSPELLFGDGVYNYYSEWIPQEYPILKPVLIFFQKGNKKLGTKQLETVANNAFYTRVEARYFLLQIYSMENQHAKAYDMAKYMWQTFPDNPYFERYFCRSAFVTGHMAEAQQAARNILSKIDQKMPGYEGVSGRNAAYVLAYYAHNYARNYTEAAEFYQKAINFSAQTNSLNAGYYVSSLIGLGKIAEVQKNLTEAQRYYKLALDKADRKSNQHDEAKKAIDNLKKARRNDRRAKRK
ncbi:tetratricopeptide repeat protein [Arundinibacter roseus]|uniref:Tetratricopeptide repeat protein n=1 Tax=Arundinibacter roseus TaxID=2070510 RepID=A0A4R4KPZ8_9BACT|nr:tetratricopeptide repeat protein [Arundinibacter roseus]TDB69006.1 tetratricopeptide repeat protein [Arundinibacter roseus]